MMLKIIEIFVLLFFLFKIKKTTASTKKLLIWKKWESVAVIFKNEGSAPLTEPPYYMEYVY